MHSTPFRLKTAQNIPEISQPEISIESGVFAQSSQSAQHSLFVPMHYEPGYAYPLIVWLHGPGGDESQLLRIMPAISARNYVAIAPRGPAAGTLGDGRVRYAWDWRREDDEESSQRVFDCVELAARKTHVARNRVFIAGFDEGGAMAFRVAMMHPECFGGVVSLCGGIPRGRAILGNLDAARRLPVFLTAGRGGEQYGASDVCADLRLLHSAGMSVTLRQYPCGQELSGQMLKDVDRWIIEQVTGARSIPWSEADRRDP